MSTKKSPLGGETQEAACQAQSIYAIARAIASASTPEECHHALWALGAPSFPVDEASKRPSKRGSWREAGHLDVWPSRAGIAMPTGIHGLVVVDLDGDPGEIIHELALAGHDLPPTLTLSTPSGGEHLWYWDPAELGNKNPLLRLPGLQRRDGKPAAIDTRGAGGYVVIPPARGRGIVLDVPVAPLPQWIRDAYGQPRVSAIRPTTRGSDSLDARVQAYLQRADPAISGSGGHSQTLQVATALAVGFDLSDVAALDYLSEWNRTCSPPWDEADLRRKIGEARKCSTRRPGYLLTEERRTTPAPAPAPASVPPPTQPTGTAGSLDDWWSPVEAPWTARERIVRDRYAPRRNLLTQRTELPDGSVVDKFVVRRVVRELELLQPRWVPDQSARSGERPVRREDVKVCEDDVLRALETVGAEAPYNPVREYLDALPEWDQVDHARSLARILSDRDDPWEATALRTWLLGCVWRAYKPGCKMDLCLWLYGPEGSGKSTLGPALVPNREWSSELKPSQMKGQFAFLTYHQSWLLELAEADQHRRDMEAFKGFLTTSVDSGQLKNENLTEFRARAFACYATTNSLSLEGTSAERRLLPVYVGGRGKWALITPEFRDQLWAQAVASYRAGVQPDLPAAAIEDHRARIAELQDAEEEGCSDPYAAKLDGWISLRQGVTTAEAMERLGIPTSQWPERRLQMAVGKSLKRLGCTRRKVRNRGWVFTLERND